MDENPGQHFSVMLLTENQLFGNLTGSDLQAINLPNFENIFEHILLNVDEFWIKKLERNYRYSLRFSYLYQRSLVSNFSFKLSPTIINQ